MTELALTTLKLVLAVASAALILAGIGTIMAGQWATGLVLLIIGGLAALLLAQLA